MPYPPIINQSSIRSRGNFQRYAIIHTGTVQFQFHPSVAASGKANAQITYSATLSGSRLNCLVGMTVFITPTSDYKADLRDQPENCLITVIRKAPTSTLLYITETAFQWATGDYVTVLDDFRLHEKRVRVAANTIFKDYDVPYRSPIPRIYDLYWDCVVIASGSSTNYSPTPLAEAMTNGASIITWRWDVIENGVVTLNASSSQNPTFNLDIGTHWLYLTVTDDGGRSNWFAMLVAVVPDTFASVVDNAIVSQINYSLSSGNTAGLDKLDDASDIVPGAPCLVITHANYRDGTTQDSVSVAGWLGAAVALGIAGDENYGQLQTYADSIQGVRVASETIRLAAFPMQELAAPHEWGEVTRLSVYDAIWHIGSEHSTLFNLASAEFPSDHTSYRFPDLQTPAGTLPEILDTLCERASFAMIGYAAHGDLFFRKSLLYESSATNRNAATVLGTYGTADGTLIPIQRQPPGLFAFNAVLGGYATFNTTNKTIRIYHSTAPAGFIPVTLLEQIDSIILAANLSDSAAKLEAGALTANHLFAATETVEVAMDMLDGYHTIVPAPHIWHKLDIDTSDTLDTMSFDSNTRLICTEVSSTYDPDNGTLDNTITLREETAGGDDYAQETQYVPLQTEQAYPTYPIEQAYPLSDFDDLEGTYGVDFAPQREGWTDPTDPQEEAVENQQPAPGVLWQLFVPFKGGAVNTPANSVLGATYEITVTNDARIGGEFWILDHSFADGLGNWAVVNGNFANGRVAGEDIGNFINAAVTLDFGFDVWAHGVRVVYQRVQPTGGGGGFDGIDVRFRPTPNSNTGASQMIGTADNNAGVRDRCNVETSPPPPSANIEQVLVSVSIDDGWGAGTAIYIDRIVLMGQDPAPSGADYTATLVDCTDDSEKSPTRGDAFYYKYQDGLPAEAYSGQGGLNLDGAGIVHGQNYSPDHTYTFTVTGTGNPFAWSFTDPDGNYVDNENKVLKLEIKQL